MKKKHYMLRVVFALLLGWVLFNNFSGNPPNGRTGAPGDGLCTDCHASNNPNGFDGSVTLTGLPASLSPNTTYSVTVTVDNPDGMASRGGFQWVALDQNNNNIGTMSNSGGSATITNQGGRTYHEHNPAQFFGGNTSLTWTVDWTSPDTPASDQDITFYAASVIGNGSGNSGDLIVTSQLSSSLSANADPLMASIENIMDATCNGVDDGSATAVASGGVPPYTFEWSNGETTATAVNLPAGTAMVTVSDSDDASMVLDAVIGEVTSISLELVSQTNIGCMPTAGSATINVSGGTPDYVYLWSNGETEPTATNLPAGESTLTVIDANNCMETITVEITEDITTPTANAGPDRTLTCDVNVVQLSGSAPGCPNCTYAWTTMDGNILNGQNSANPNVDAAGTYILLVTNPDNQCTATDEVMVLGDFAVPLVDLGPEQLLCSGDSLMLSPVVSGGTPPFSYMWNNDLDDSPTQTVTPLATTNYTVTVLGDNGCFTISSVLVTVLDPLEISLESQTDVSCNGEADGAIGMNVANATPPVIFSWSNGAETQNISNLAAGSYFLTATDGNGCSDQFSVTINEPAALSLDINKTDESEPEANDGTATAVVDGGTAPYEYMWSNGETGSQIINLSPDIYRVTVTDANDCTITGDINIAAFDCAINATAVETDVSCNGGSDGMISLQIINAVDPVSIQWSNGDTSATIMDLIAGNYAASLTDAANCTFLINATVNEPDAIISNLSTQDESSFQANDGSAVVNPQGGTPPYTVQWSNGDTGNTVTGLSPGGYNLTITDDNGCETVESFSIAVFECGTITFDIEQLDNQCDGDTDGMLNIINVQGANGQVTYMWSNGAMTASIDNLTNGNYSVTLTDESNCSQSASYEITAMDTIPPVITCPADTTANTCTGLQYADPTVNDNCTLTGPELIEGLSSGAIFPVGTTTVSYQATDAAGNTSTCSFEVTIINDLSAVAIGNPVSCFGGSDGSVQVTVSGGTPPYEIQGGGQNLPAGTYSFTVEDANGCTTQVTATVDQPAEIAVTNVVITPATIGDIEVPGSIDLDVSGGTGQLTFEWTDENGMVVSTMEDLTDSGSGDFTLTITDENGCQVMQTYTVPLVTGTNELALLRKWEVYPNPAKEVLNLRMELETVQSGWLELYHIQGKQILRKQLSEQRNYQVDLDVSPFPAGIYLLMVKMDGQIKTEKIIIE